MGEPTSHGRRLLLRHGLGAAFLAPFPGRAEKHRQPRPRPLAAAATPLIVLDPGHGGKDPGAIGVSGTYEKHIAFAAVRELAGLLSASGNYRVSLTRHADVFIPLEDRVAYAQAIGASLFMSLHADALPDHAVGGASVYVLAATASDRQSAQLAQRENAADRFIGPEAQGVSPQVARILASLVRQETRAGSARMQQQVVASLGDNIKLLENPSRHAAFAVLKAADIPSVLVEMGFMSNARDEQALREPSHRAMIAAAMKRAVDRYFATRGQFAQAG